MNRIITLLLLSFCCSSFSQNIVADLKIQGNKKLKSSLVKKISNIKSGVALDSSVIEEDIRLLKLLPSVAHAYYQVFPTEVSSKFNVYYNVEENFTIIPSANIYTTNDDEFAYRLGLYEFNLFGQNMIFGGFYQKDIYSSYAVNFRAQNLFSRSLGLAMNYQNLTTREPVFFNRRTADYKYNNESFEVLGLYQINFSNRIEFGVNYFTEDYQYKSGATDPNVPQALVVRKMLYKLIYDYNALNYDYQSVDGFRSLLNFQYVHARDDSQLPGFLIGWNDFLYYKRFGKNGNWANRVRLGLATNNKTPFAPFSVDNNVNLRGVGNTIDRGTAAIVVNSEYRYTLYEKNWFVLQGNAFVDAGTWRNPGGNFSDFSDSKNLRVYPGLGLRFIHKKIYNAIFRIDYGIGVTPNATQGLVFGIGQYF
ncbi:BamA/TamA family outer membrane protein [Winogradskyella endarachnes]|uniref:Outer membrane protein assembly factor n=1 Tax=Winogradskyella endarachnes TaxID=2681965 RepID=A0A6L6U9S6_9FLAO|nr:outer membrane protein assembly factor [Winogradskyella endarachnes]MUU78779.1 outer membrane protein assembly factor [Winogradskyella endarachnes]